MPPHQENKEEWKKDLKELMGNELYFRDFVNFISDLLSAKSAEIEEIINDEKKSSFAISSDNPQYSLGKNNGFQIGLDEAIKIIKQILH